MLCKFRIGCGDRPFGIITHQIEPAAWTRHLFSRLAVGRTCLEAQTAVDAGRKLLKVDRLAHRNTPFGSNAVRIGIAGVKLESGDLCLLMIERIFVWASCSVSMVADNSDSSCRSWLISSRNHASS